MREETQYSNFGRYLRHLIRARTTMSSFLGMMSVSRAAIHKYATGTAQPSAARIAEITEALQLTNSERTYLELLAAYDRAPYEVVRAAIVPQIRTMAPVVGDTGQWFQP